MIFKNYKFFNKLRLFKNCKLLILIKFIIIFLFVVLKNEKRSVINMHIFYASLPMSQFRILKEDYIYIYRLHSASAV